MDRQCSSCGGFCKKSGCERENVKSEPNETAPPQREWQGLTDEEIGELWGEPVDFMYSGHYDSIRAIEQAIKEKNHARH